jgi:hypothetical protein
VEMEMFRGRHSTSATTSVAATTASACAVAAAVGPACAPAPALAPAPTLPTDDHPLAAFFADRLMVRPWLRTRCGTVSKAYRKWCAEADPKPAQMLHHVAFAREMTRFVSREGHESRPIYVGVAVKTDPATAAAAPSTESVGRQATESQPSAAPTMMGAQSGTESESSGGMTSE